MMKSPDGKSRFANKRITKTCKECNKQVPTACKACPCGYHFRKTSFGEAYPDNVSSVSMSNSSLSDAALGRRTQRTRRARPHFFDSLEYGTHIRRNKVTDSVIESGGNKLRGWPKTPGAKSKVKTSNKPKIGVGKPKKTALATSTTAETIVSTASITPDVAPKDMYTNAGGSSSSCSSRDEDIHGVMTAEKALHYSIILAEINRKYTSVTFRPPV